MPLHLLLLIGPLLGAPPSPAAAEPCLTSASPESLAKRASPLDSVSFQVGGAQVKICYSRPSSRGRVMIGGRHVPYGRLWRTGANEPTMIHTSAPINVGDVALAAGTWSLYTIPGKAEWAVILNRSIEQWGDEGSYDAVKGDELGRTTVKVEHLEKPIETFTIRTEPARQGVLLILEWEHTRIAVPITPRKAP